MAKHRKGNVCTVKNKRRLKAVCKRNGVNSKTCKTWEKKLRNCK